MSALLSIICLLCVLRQTNGAAFQSLDPCPDDISPGESWVPQDMQCSRCDCDTHPPGYACYSCGVFMLPLQPGCYMDKESPFEPYPDCCNVKEFCPGDERFNASLLALPVG